MRLSSALLGIKTRLPSRRTCSSLRAINRSIVRRLTPSMCAASCFVIAICCLTSPIVRVSLAVPPLPFQPPYTAVQLFIALKSVLDAYSPDRLNYPRGLLDALIPNLHPFRPSSCLLRGNPLGIKRWSGIVCIRCGTCLKEGRRTKCMARGMWPWGRCIPR